MGKKQYIELNSPVLQDLRDYVRRKLMEQWEGQGHSMTGAAVRAVEDVVNMSQDAISMVFTAPQYSIYIDRGVGADRIPYSEGSGKKRSKYIDALVRYAQKRMNITDLKVAKSVAFAIAKTQKKQGMPTRGSYQYSRTGKRVGWINEMYEQNQQEIAGYLFAWLDESFTDFCTEMQVEFNKEKT